MVLYIRKNGHVCKKMVLYISKKYGINYIRNGFLYQLVLYIRIKMVFYIRINPMRAIHVMVLYIRKTGIVFKKILL